MKLFLRYTIDRAKKIRDFFLLPIAARSPFLSAIYYSFFNFSFYREFQSVLSARVDYNKQVQGRIDSQVLLRRNIHKLEKGLIMKPRRSLFALGFIEETVNAFSNIAHKYALKDKSVEELGLFWARDVLNNYFSVVDRENEIISKAYEKFRLNKLIEEKSNKVPFNRNFNKKQLVSYEALLALSSYRRSVRWFADKEVPRDLIDKAVEIAGNAPSACNRQPFKFYIYDDKQLVQEISRLPMGTAGYSHNIKGIIAIVGNLDAYYSERDRHVIYIDGGLASMGLIYALEVQGIASCCINWPDIGLRERKIAKLLKLRKSQRVIMLMAYGYEAEDSMVPYSQKRSIEELRIFNT